MRLIDADAYSKKVCTYNETGCGSCKFQTKCPVDEPVIDAEPVIRCKDCEYAKLIDKEDGWYECRHDKRVMHSDGYCSWAERMDTDETD